MSLKNFFLYQKLIGMISVIVVLLNVKFINDTFLKLEDVETKKILSTQYADELRQSSDDLTKFVRLYSVTGDDKYEKIYWDILKIRNGEMERPENYHMIYWDLVLNYGDKPKADGNKKALSDMMKEVGVTDYEFSLINEASNNSNELVNMEVIAMNAVKGIFVDNEGNFTVKKEPDLGFATALLHSQEYMNQKANIFKPIDKFLYDLEERTSKDIEEVENELHFYTNFLILFICFSIATFVTLFYLNKNQIPNLYYFSSELVNFFKYLNNEMPYNGIIKLNANNEIGQMVKVVNENIERTKEKVEEDRKFIDETINVLNKFEKGDLSQRLETKVKNFSLMKLEEVLNKMAFNLENHIENVLKILNEYSKYNYLNKISTKGITNHLLKLANGINILASSITQMLVENKKNGLVLEKSSKILLENVDKLNTSSNESATSLEETASALEQITSNLRNNTQRIEKMAHYSSAITKSSSNGEELANKTTLAMDEINKQVTLVNQAINVIDQIAFQTNILGLNASVEAVTAGETGKGFAVVAQEVRNLASRSTQAAKEIKDIVHLATTKANEGKDIASDMIEGYRELNKSIKETVELISDIEMSSKEQLLGIEQINIAVNILDKQTQENSSVASKTDIIAKNTNEIAVFIVAEVDKKDFEGKNDFKEDI